MARVRTQARRQATVKSTTTINWRDIWQIGVIPLTLDRMSLSIAGLLLGVVLSALSMVYVKNVNRHLSQQIASARTQQQQLHNQNDNLLLRKMKLKNERSIADQATNQLNMKLPSPQKTTIVKQ